ncbi:hypothetical protein NQ318_014728 [Aromia moschata]|uniref:RING-type E3 ubiquitin transferase n=1 Tax=Aromia moschata TaxID=1265417 RepID=A0AAV8ZBL9_9CUCU|nr:hypothetical protein NQ318_014728 [Aromia moschata]
MNIGILEENRVICRFNLRGMCRFGTRCRNIHESAEKLTEKLEAENKVIASEMNSACALGACALSPRKFKEAPQSSRGGGGQQSNKENEFGPSTSSVREAVALVKKAESEDKTCGICFDTVLQKVNKSEQTFGILAELQPLLLLHMHQKMEAEQGVRLRHFVYPSKFWVDNKQEKDEFIDCQKQRMKKLDCKYFRKGKGKCPFGNTCLYLHALPNGKVMDVGPPRPRRRRPGYSPGIDSELVNQILFWLNEDDLEYDDSEFDLDLSDPCIAMQYYDHDDIRRYIAMDRLMRGSDTDDDDSDCDFLFL